MTAQESTGASALSRRALLLNGAVAAAFATFRPAPALAQAVAPATVEADAIRPFHADVPAAALVDLRQRLAATRWPDPGRSTTAPRAFSLRSFSHLSATGRLTTTGVKPKRS